MSPRIGGWRVALRLARREAWRRKAQTALMLVLVCLPVLAVAAAAVVWRTANVSGAEGVDRRMGSAAALVSGSGTSAVLQGFDPDGPTRWVGEDEHVATAEEVRGVLGADRELVPFAQEYLGYRTDRGVADLLVTETDLASPLTDGLFRLEDGRYPRTADEVVVNAAVTERGPGLGQTLTVLRRTADGESRTELRVVGIVVSATTREEPVAAVLSGAIGVPDGQPAWLVGGAPVGWDDVRALNAVGLLAASRAVLSDPPPSSAQPPEVVGDEPVDETRLTALVLVVTMVLLEVVLLAGPAFAVRARAQARALALVAATGGTPAQARRMVLASGVVVGLLGGVLGVVLGIGVGALLVPVAQRFQGTWFGPFEVPWSVLLAVAGFGLAAAVLAAVVPAVSASRQDVVAVLAGRRGEGRPSRRSPVLGLLLVAAGAAAGILGSRASGASPALVGASALLSVLGMILLVATAVAGVARLARRFPLALRFAARDAARHRTRTVPAVAAVGATVAGVVTLAIALSSQQAADERDYDPQLAHGYGAVALDPGGDPAVARRVLATRLPADRVDEVAGVRFDDAGPFLELQVGTEPLVLPTSGVFGTGQLVATSAPAALGLSNADRDRADRALAAGQVVVLRGDDAFGPEVSDQVRVVLGERISDLPAVTVRPPGGLGAAALILPPAVATDLHLTVATTGLVLAPPLSATSEVDLDEALASTPGTGTLVVERGYQPEDSVRILQWVLAVLGGILMLGGTLTATFLALSDARPDLATMAAVGARARTRRRVASSYALVVGLVGALLGAPIGFVPGLAVSRPLSRGDDGSTLLAVPWPLLALVVVGLPLLTAAAVGLCARSRLPVVARID
ncbi:FtsX-like permease family protein [Nocardioides nitrophenolicus]|uniref:FtsX-like permease family protein n=1 Tax=Nocardioides nitrophenolicus TaxID=60489 RepID=UPI001959E85B|nr:FtsX-like permease family protein [Nocardioides nitrophenolicus]MBM7517405.1 putative ABC transport system permease protein [Nocardioides nitrophenolicus]